MFFSQTMEERYNKNSHIEQLLLAISSGDSASMGVLYDLIKTDVFAYALSKLGNKSDAEDITQDTFVQVYKHAKQYVSKGKPMAWIITIELNLINRFFVLKARTSPFEECFENTPSNEDVQEKVVDNAFLSQLLSVLNEEEREILVLHVVSGMKHREIAKVLSKPLSTVLSKYNRAIKKLQFVKMES